VSQRHRHGYAADLPHGLPGLVKEPSREVPAAKRSGETHRARPLSARFEPVYGMKDVTTPVPHVLLSATLTGPAPSGSTGTSRLCQGCSRPPRHHPDQAALSYTAPLRQDGGEGLSPPLEQQRLAAPCGAGSRRSLEDVRKVLTGSRLARCRHARRYALGVLAGRVGGRRVTPRTHPRTEPVLGRLMRVSWRPRDLRQPEPGLRRERVSRENDLAVFTPCWENSHSPGGRAQLASGPLSAESIIASRRSITLISDVRLLVRVDT
jgi:hypothetical protein